MWGDASGGLEGVYQQEGFLHDGPTMVTVNSMIRSISKIDDYKMVRFFFSVHGWCVHVHLQCESKKVRGLFLPHLGRFLLTHTVCMYCCSSGDDSHFRRKKKLGSSLLLSVSATWLRRAKRGLKTCFCGKKSSSQL